MLTLYNFTISNNLPFIETHFSCPNSKAERLATNGRHSTAIHSTDISRITES